MSCVAEVAYSLVGEFYFDTFGGVGGLKGIAISVAVWLRLLYIHQGGWDVVLEVEVEVEVEVGASVVGGRRL